MLTIREKVLSVFKDQIGEKFLREEIIGLVVNAYPEIPRSSVVPTDYCYNMINKGKKFDFHLFESLSLNGGIFRFLGLNYPYTGPIYWKGEQVGSWKKGKYELWKDPTKIRSPRY
jgi:hypothetical protein